MLESREPGPGSELSWWGVWLGQRKGPRRDREGMPGIGRVLALVTEAPEGVGISGWRGCNRPGMVLSRV